MRRGPYAWFLQRLDFFLREDQRRAPPDDVSRYRVILATASLLTGLSTFYLLGALKLADPFQTVLATSCIVGYVCTLLFVRTSTAPWPPGLLLCSIMAGSYVSAGLRLGGPNTGAHIASTLIPLLAFFLMGARGSFFFAALMALYATLIHPLYLAGFDVSSPLFSGTLELAGNLFAALCILGVWGLVYVHSRARDDAQAALERTLRGLGESERKLSSLVECTDDVVCSLDSQGRLLTANAAMKKWFSRLFGQEPLLGEPIDTPLFLQQHPDWPLSLTRVLRGESVRAEVTYSLAEYTLALDFSLTPIPGEDGRPAGVTIFGRDISARLDAETRLGELHRSLMEASRKAGMAEIATGVLHNVGNTLNSVNVSATLIAERLRGSRVTGLARAAEMLQAHTQELGTFLTQDEKGRLLPEYFLSASRQLVQEQQVMLTEVQSLTKNVEHIKSVVGMQQEHAKFSGLMEHVTLPELIDDALRLHATSFDRLGIHVRRDYAEVPAVLVDRHRLLQILVNLLSNARHALLESERTDKQLTLRVLPVPQERLRIEVADNGVGISSENLARLFTQGFTTKKSGHGFGLHASALAAAEMKGSLTCASAGRDQGATFAIELPLTGEPVRT
ncbi:ATP-binding protein [Hyalangium rubrum]|uniref:histidine kinase n=1 Tax=Hyalangium rubrum TaxID=3103134 RepID=A0ABU5GUZ8_9BACT|nr:ATP-binding protein [Hyalangium sp. s54d21]MDY7224991.1 ATP-binding protein [Hyalangium sp. s54d21]